MKQRDRQLDSYRALIMIYILCVIHVLYWCPNNFSLLKSIALFEMPVIFFISGAAVQVKGGDKSGTWQIIKNRFKRVAMPYYIYAAISICVIAMASAVSFGEYDITQLSGRDFIDILLAKQISQIPFVKHLWFITPYMILLCTFHFQTKILDKMRYSVIYLLVAFLIFAATTQISDSRFLRNCLCYNCFLIAGYLFYRKISRLRLLLISLALGGIMLAWLSAGEHFAPMQSHKFPPDIFFLLFGMLVLSVLGLAFSFIRIPDCYILDRWNRCGYTIYLYQNFAFIAATSLLDTVIPTTSVIRSSIMAVVVFAISTFASYILEPMELKIRTFGTKTVHSLTRLMSSS